MSKKVQFKKGVDVKNKTTIEVIHGWNTCYRIKQDELNEKGKPIYKYYDKYMITEFNILEEGTDEITQSHKHKQSEKEKHDFSFDTYNDELPF